MAEPEHDAAEHSGLVRPSRKEIVGCMLEMIFCVMLFGSMFCVFVTEDVSSSRRDVSRTGWDLLQDGAYQLAYIPLLALVVFAVSLRGLGMRAANRPAGWSFLGTILQLVAVGVLWAWRRLLLLPQDLWLIDSGVGGFLRLAGMAGIAALAFVRLAGDLSERMLSARGWSQPRLLTWLRGGAQRPAPPPEPSRRWSLRALAAVESVAALVWGVVLAAMVIAHVLEHFLRGTRIDVVSCAVLGLTVFALATMARGIRSGEGWAAIAHIVCAVAICALNVCLMISDPRTFFGMTSEAVVWSLFPLFAGIVLYVLFIHAHDDINWPYRFTRCGGCWKRHWFKANPCPLCGNPLKPMTDSPAEEYCIYCKMPFPAKPLRCRACRKTAPSSERP